MKNTESEVAQTPAERHFQQRAELKREIEKGLESGVAADFDLRCFLAKMNARHVAKLQR